MVAARCNDIKLYEIIRNEEISYDYQDRNGWTALHHCANTGSVDFMKNLLENGMFSCNHCYCCNYDNDVDMKITYIIIFISTVVIIFIFIIIINIITVNIIIIINIIVIFNI